MLSYLFPDGTDYFNAQIDEAAISRLYGAIHYRADIEVGKDQGRRVGGYTVRFAQRDGADGPRPAAVTAVQTLDGASFRSPVAPGSMATVFQPDLVATLSVADTVPLPTSLGGFSMKFQPFDSRAPLRYFAQPSQYSDSLGVGGPRFGPRRSRQPGQMDRSRLSRSRLLGSRQRFSA